MKTFKQRKIISCHNAASAFASCPITEKRMCKSHVMPRFCYFMRFYYFTLEIKDETKKDRKFLPMKEIAQHAGPKWDQLSDSEQADYKERDRTGKEQGSGSPPIELRLGVLIQQ